MKTVLTAEGQPLQISDAEYLRAVRSGRIEAAPDETVNLQSPEGEVVSMRVGTALQDERYRGWRPIESEIATEAAQQYEYDKPGWKLVSGLSSLGMGSAGLLAGMGNERAQEDIRRAREVNPGSALLGTAVDTALTLGAGAAAGASRAVGASRLVQALRAPEAALTTALTPTLGRLGAAAAREAVAGAVMGAAQHAIDSSISDAQITVEGVLASGALGAVIGGATGALTERALLALERRAVDVAGDRLLTRATRWLGPSRKEATQLRMRADADPLYREAVLRTALDDIPRIAGAPISELDAGAAHKALQQLREEIGSQVGAIAKEIDRTGETIPLWDVTRRLRQIMREYKADPALRARANEVESFLGAFEEIHAAKVKAAAKAGQKVDPKRITFSQLAEWRSSFGNAKSSAFAKGDRDNPAIRIYEALSAALEDGVSRAIPKLARGTATAATESATATAATAAAAAGGGPYRAPGVLSQAAPKPVEPSVAEQITASLGAPIEKLWAARNARYKAVADLEEIARRGLGREGANRTWSLGDRLFAMTGAYVGSQIGGPVGAGVGYVISAGGGRLVRLYGDQWTASIMRTLGDAARRGEPMTITSAVQLAARQAVESIRRGAPAADTAFARGAAALGNVGRVAGRRGYGAIVSHYLPPIKVSIPAARYVAGGGLPTGFETRTPRFAAAADAAQRRAAKVIIRYAPADLERASPVDRARAQHASDAVIGGLPHVLDLARRGDLTPTHWAAFAEAYPTIADEIRSAIEDGDLRVSSTVRKIVTAQPADPVIQDAIARGPSVPPTNRPVPKSTEAREFETRADRLENTP